MKQALVKTDFNFDGQISVYHGKVRDVYNIEDELLVMVVSDRISAFDVVLPKGIPYKGQVLNQLTNWWMAKTADILPNHLVSEPDPNAVVVLEAQPILVEVIVRGYITGVTSTALWYRYSLGEREIYGYHFAEGLRKNQALPAPIITPTSKAADGDHDAPLTESDILERGLLSRAQWRQISETALALFARGQALAAERGLILVKGSVPGPKGSLVVLRTAAKKGAAE